MRGKLKDHKILAVTCFLLSTFTLTGVGHWTTVSWGADSMKKAQQKIDAFRILVVNEDPTDKGMEKAYTFAGIIIDRARRVKRNITTAEVKVRNEMPDGKNPGESYDVIFLIRPSYVKEGEILTFTSEPIENCRAFLKTFLTSTLSSKRIDKAYKGGKLKPAEHLTHDLQGDGWLGSCAG
jgi:hypothetical protein